MQETYSDSYRDDLVAQTRNFRQELHNYRGDNDATVMGEESLSFFLCADSHLREETIDMQISKKAHRHIRYLTLDIRIRFKYIKRNIDIVNY